MGISYRRPNGLSMAQEVMMKKLRGQIEDLAKEMVEATLTFTRSRHIEDELPEEDEIDHISTMASIWSLDDWINPELRDLKELRLRIHRYWMDNFHDEYVSKFGLDSKRKDLSDYGNGDIRVN